MILVTGANGFVGSELTTELKRRKIDYRAGVRQTAGLENEIIYGDLATRNDWRDVLTSIDTIVHLAARVHVMNEVTTDPLSEFRKVNVSATLHLAKAAKASGVKKFIFMSSIKVNGEETLSSPFTSQDRPRPLDAYGVSKAEAEEELLKLHEKGTFEVMIIRPPLVYGGQARANFKLLLKLVASGFPLPFACVDNRRSFVSVKNLADFIIFCAQVSRREAGIFLVSDGYDLSLKDLLLAMGRVSGKKVLLFPVPVRILKCLLALIGKNSFSSRLFGNLQVDITDTEKILGWKPKYSFDETFNG